MEIGRTRLALLLTSRTRLRTLIKGWNPVLAMRTRKVNQQVGLGVGRMGTRRAIKVNVRVGISLRLAGVRRIGMPCGQVLQPGAALKKARPVCLFAFAASALKGKVLFVNALDVVIHRILVDFPNVAVGTDIEPCFIPLVLTSGSRGDRKNRGNFKNSRDHWRRRNRRHLLRGKGGYRVSSIFQGFR